MCPPPRQVHARHGDSAPRTPLLRLGLGLGCVALLVHRAEVGISIDCICEVGGASGVPAHLYLRLPDHLGMPSETKI